MSPLTLNSLLVIDQAPLLEEALGACQGAYAEIERLKAELRFHEARDLPAYERWYNGTFGAYLSLMREFTSAIHSKTVELAQLRKQHWTRFFGGCEHILPEQETVGEFVEEEEDDRENEEAPRRARFSEASSDEDGGEGWDEDETWAGQEEYRYEEARFYDDEQGYFYEEDSDFARNFERRFASGSSWRAWSYRGRGRYGGDERARQGRRQAPGSEAGVRPEPELAPDLASRLRERYRTLVKKLHPDLNDELTPEEKSLWHRVQLAYRENNIEQLDLLAAMADVLGGKLAATTSLHQLRSVAREIEALVAPLERKLEEARQNRAWKFTELRDRNDLRSRVEKEFQRELAVKRRELEQLRAQIKRFSRLPEAADRLEPSP